MLQGPQHSYLKCNVVYKLPSTSQINERYCEFVQYSIQPNDFFEFIPVNMPYQRKPIHKLNQNTKENKGANSTKTPPYKLSENTNDNPTQTQ